MSYLIDDAFTFNVLCMAGYAFKGSDAVYELVEGKLIPDVYVKGVFWVQGHPIYAFGRELIALDGPTLVNRLLLSRNVVLLTAGREAITHILAHSAFMLERGGEKVLRENASKLTVLLKDVFGLQWGIPTYRWDAKTGLQPVDQRLDPTAHAKDYEAWSPKAHDVVTVHPTWDRADVVNFKEPAEPPTEEQIFSHDINSALAAPAPEERAYTLLRLYNRCFSQQKWGYVKETKEWIERQGYHVVDGLGDGDLARLAKKEI